MERPNNRPPDGCAAHKTGPYRTGCQDCFEEVFNEGDRSLALLQKLYDIYVYCYPGFAGSDPELVVKMVTSEKNGELVELWKMVKDHLRK